MAQLSNDFNISFHLVRNDDEETFDTAIYHLGKLVAMTGEQPDKNVAHVAADAIISLLKDGVPYLGLDIPSAYVKQLVKSKGFINDRSGLWQLFTLTHTEISEAAQAFKRGEGDAKIVEELVDALIRIFHMLTILVPPSEVEEVFRDKMHKNWLRPYQYNLGPDSLEKK